METQSVHGSPTYIWYVKDLLGQGAAGSVYKGRHRRTGEVYAIKTFSHNIGYIRTPVLQMREFEVLKKLRHDNIVRLLAIEDENITKEKILVMELCVGGSLYNILEEPENAYGLVETEFLCVLRDVAAGMKCLRDNGIVHRDIKPGNIMRHIEDDGRSVYKLIDFGAARELQEEEQFTSLYGTEEYLHPDMYERAVLRRPLSKLFSASVDLWSVGVTLYHVATGQLPFRPFGGRKNQETMYRITTQKQSGVISGVQLSANGDIEWSRELPSMCQLSKGLKQLITPLLAGLLECDFNQMWSFDQFFEEVAIILEKKIITVFNTLTASELHIFANPNSRLAMFQELLAQQAVVHHSQQLLLYENHPFNLVVDPLESVSHYPSTSKDNPIFLFLKNSSDDLKYISVTEVPFPAIQPSQVLINEDVVLTKTCCGIVYYMYRLCQQCIHNQNLIRKAARMFLLVYTKQFDHVREIFQPVRHYVSEMQKREQLLLNMQQILNKLPSQSRLSANVLDSFHTLVKICSDYRQHQNDATLSQTLNQYGCQEDDRCIQKIEVALKSVVDIFNQFKKDKQQKKLAHNEEQIHRFEKVKLQVLCAKIQSITYNHCLKKEEEMFYKFKLLYGQMYEKSRNLSNVEKQVDDLMEYLLKMSTDLDEEQTIILNREEKPIQNRLEISVQNNKPEIIDASTNTTRSHKQEILSQLDKSLTLLLRDSDDVKNLMLENKSIFTQFEKLAAQHESFIPDIS